MYRSYGILTAGGAARPPSPRRRRDVIIMYRYMMVYHHTTEYAEMKSTPIISRPDAKVNGIQLSSMLAFPPATTAKDNNKIIIGT